MSTSDDSTAGDHGEGRPRESTAPTFGLLLEAAFAPHVIRERVAFLPQMERDEALDALDHGGLKSSWLVLGWATENGSAVASGSMVTIDQEEFLESLAETQAFVALEYSAPLQQRAASGPVMSRNEAPRLGPLKTQRLHVVDRHAWEPFPPLANAEDDAEDVSLYDDAPERELSLFGEPSNVVTEGERIGEVWVRIAPTARAALLDQGEKTLRTLAIVTRARADMLRSLIHRDQSLDRARLKALNQDLVRRSQLLDDIGKAIDTVAKASTDKERRHLTEAFFSRYGKAREGYYGPLLRGELDHLIPDEFEWATELRDELELLVSELGTIVVEYRTDRGLREKLDRWKRRVREALSKVGLAAEADRLDALQSATVNEDAEAAREMVEILIEELHLHPEHYEASMMLSADQKKHDDELLVRYRTALPIDGRAMRLITSRFKLRRRVSP